MYRPSNSWSSNFCPTTFSTGAARKMQMIFKEIWTPFREGGLPAGRKSGFTLWRRMRQAANCTRKNAQRLTEALFFCKAAGSFFN